MVISNNSTLDKDLFLHNHHITDDIFVKPMQPVYMYNNLCPMTICNTDYQYLAQLAIELVNIGIMIEMLKGSHTLIGLMTAVAIMGMTCSSGLIGAMICVALIGIEISSTLSNGVYGISTATRDISANSYRIYNLKKLTSTSDKYIREFYKKSAALIPSSIYIFNKLKDGYKPSQYMDVYKLSFDIAHFIHLEQSEGTQFIMSIASMFCTLQACAYGCYAKTGTYLQSHRLHFPIESADINIHNVLFKYSFPYLKFGSRIPNDFFAFMNKYILLAHHSHFDVHERLAREHKILNHANYMRTGNIGKDTYTFNNVAYSIPTTGTNIYDLMKKYISYDTIKHVILEVGLKDLGSTYVQEYISIYENILALGTSMVTYSDYFKGIYQGLTCRAYGYPTFHISGDHFTSLPDYSTRLKLSQYSMYTEPTDGLYGMNGVADDPQKRSLMTSWFGGDGDSIFYMALSVMNYPRSMKRIEGGNLFMHIHNILSFYSNIDSFVSDITANANLLEYIYDKPIINYTEIKAAILGSGNYEAYEDLHPYTHVANILLDNLPHLLSGRSTKFDRVF